MLCNWSTKTNILIPRSIKSAQNAARKSPALTSCPVGIWHNNIASRPYLKTTSSYHSFKSTPPMQGLPAIPNTRSYVQPPTTVHHPPPSTTPPPLLINDLTSAQLSRASAAAVRVSVARGDIWDSFHLWNSLRWSMHHYHKPGFNSASRPPFRSPTTAFEPINFGRPVSTRLSGHCLFHGLLRAGETKKAAMLAEQMMAYGEELHPLSFNTLLRQLHPSTTQNPHSVDDRLRSLTPRPKVPLGPRVLELQNVMPADPFTRLAVHLLSSAREHRWQRTTGMYESVLRACLFQGEILVASLLLALLLKDYQLRHACSRAAAEAGRVGEPDTIAYVHSKVPDAPSRGFKCLPNHSSFSLYQSITKFLKEHCAHVDDPLFPEASQALANLASALDARRIPYADLALLIKVLYSYPQCQHTIWITLPSGEWQSRNAHRYFHRVLLNLLHTIPDRHASDLNTNPLPALNLNSYHAMLNYAMRLRHSLELAHRVLHHMTELRHPQLAPDMVTYNIVLRGSTLMRRNDIAENVWRIIQSRIGSCAGDLELRHHNRIRGLLEETHKYELSIPKPIGPLKPDNTLLTSYMAHLIATGRPEAVATVIAGVIPDFEPRTDTTPEERIARQQTSVVRGVALGPHFFAVALNALCKAGRRNLAERIWILARAAEAESLQSGGRVPWCLSVHAYTAMLQLYAKETRGWHVSNSATCAGHTRRPRDPIRAILGLRKGMQVFRALPLAADRVHEAAVRAHKEGRKWKNAPVPPKPDARFYNAALSLVDRRPGMRSRGSLQGSRSRWNQMLSEARQRFLLTGQRPHSWTPELEEIAMSLRKSGYALPIGFRLSLVGRDEQVTTSEDKTDLGARPYSFGRNVRARFAPHRIPTVKKKGILVSSWRRRSRWMVKQCSRGDSY